jgi:predicted nucleic acid-binding protein
MIYADAGFLVALKIRTEVWNQAARRFYEARQDETWLWSPWHRVEVFNTIRQLTRNTATGLRKPDAIALIQLIETEVRLDYFTHMERDWRDVLRTANEISISQSFDRRCRSADLLHVAYAVELSAATFVSFDNDQVALAKAAGLEAVLPA